MQKLTTHYQKLFKEVVMLVTRQNHYNGVNAHYMSFVQDGEEWVPFHTGYIVHLWDQISDTLPEGYYVLAEKSLQIIELNPNAQRNLYYPKPDVTVFATAPVRQVSRVVAPNGTIVASLGGFDEIAAPYTSLVIYKKTYPEDTAITRFELMSPTNKVGTGMLDYVDKRYKSLRSKVNQIDIDLLHFLVSPIQGVPSYPDDEDSAPYNISIGNPHPSYEQGSIVTFPVHVDQPLPTIEIPLADGDSVHVDFDSPFQHVFRKHLPAQRSSDYTQLPVHFDHYHPDDQARIQAVMARVQNAANSVNLNQQRVLA
jgi:hypothetical protein